MRLQKEQSLHKRNQEGELLPQEVRLESIEGNPTILVLPLTYPEIKSLKDLNSEESKKKDVEIIVNNCVEPKYNLEEAEHLLPTYQDAITTAIISLSVGVSQEKIRNAKQEESLVHPAVEKKS